MTRTPSRRRRLLDRPDPVYPIVGLVLSAVLVLGAIALAVVTGLATRGL